MAIQFNVATRNARIDIIESLNGPSCALQIRTGSKPANCASANTGSVLATINLPANWMEAAVDAVGLKKGTWSDASADNTGTADHFRIFNNQTTKDETTCFIQGTVGMAAADMIVDNDAFVAGQSFTITTFRLTDGNA